MDLSFHRGLLTGVHWAITLLRPLSATPRPRCPYPLWRPLRRLCWRLGFSMGVYQTLYRR